MLQNLHRAVKRAFSDCFVDCRDANTGQTRWGLVVLYFAVPALSGLAAALWVRERFPVGTLFPAAALMAGMLMGAVSLLFGRVKDATTVARPEAGRDPVYYSMVAFRTAKWCVHVALVLNAALLLSVVLGASWGNVSAGVTVALMVHLGMKVWNLVRGIGAQAASIAGSRAVPPAPLFRMDAEGRMTRR